MHTSKKRAVFVALFALTYAGCRKPAGPAAVTVNGEAIALADVERRLAAAPAAYRQYSSSPEGRREFLKLLVRERLLLEEGRRSGLDRDTSYIDAVKQFEADVQARMQEYRTQLLVRSTINKLQGGELAVSDADLRRYYDSHAAEFQKPVAIEVSHILLSTLEAAEQAQQRLRGGESFEAVARQMSLDPATAVKGGKLEPVKRGALVPEFEDAAFALKIGETSGPVKSPFGFHIIRKSGERVLPPVPFDAAKAEIRARLEKDKFETWVKQKEAAATIQFNDNALTMSKPSDRSAP